MKTLIMAALAAGVTVQAQAAPVTAPKPTVVLVHGAFADSSSWNGVVTILQRHGYRVVAAANPLRSVRTDADAVSDIVKSIKGPVVLVGHSYGGSVISEAAEGRPNVKALVYVAAFAPDAGETALGLTSKFPGSTLGPRSHRRWTSPAAARISTSSRRASMISSRRMFRRRRRV